MSTAQDEGGDDSGDNQGGSDSGDNEGGDNQGENQDDSQGGEGENIRGSCTGTCVNIRQNPSCSGYIHLGLCTGGYGCCI